MAADSRVPAPDRGSAAAAAAAAAAAIPNLRDRIPKLQPRRRPPPPSNPTPVPATPPLPPPVAEAARPGARAGPFALPRRRILSPHDHELFLASPTCTLLQAWVFGLAEAVADTPAGVFAEALAEVRAEAKSSVAAPAAALPGQWQRPPRPAYQKTSLPQRPLSRVVRALLGVLDGVEALVYAHPPDDAGGSRFGNKRFRGFVDAVRAQAPQWQRDVGAVDDDEEKEEEDKAGTVGAVAETAAYFCQSFGNRARIDYGSGHELHFVVWLLCLYQLGLVTLRGPGGSGGGDGDGAALVLVVFARYLDVMRLVQTTYYLEPAGSHGVWGLDDYQFLPFLFGAAQLLHHPYITPRAVHQPLTLEQFGDDYLYLGQVRFVNAVKAATAAPTAAAAAPDGAMRPAAAAAGSSSSSSSSHSSLRWHSPMLDDISAAKSWEKVEAGMRRMFLAEVLRKLPVMQHFLFGSLVPAAPGMAPPREAGAGEEEEDDDDAAEDAIADGNDAVDVFEQGGVRHIHTPTGWGDCCGIRVPSSLGAAGEMRKRGGEVLRRIPFD